MTSVRIKERACHIRHTGRKGFVIKSDGVGTFRESKEQEQPAFRMGPAYSFGHIFFEERDHVVALFLVVGYALCQVAVKGTAAHEFCRYVLIQHRGTQVKRLLADIDAVQ